MSPIVFPGYTCIDTSPLFGCSAILRVMSTGRARKHSLAEEGMIQPYVNHGN